ncbi:hypothetical protein ACJX0J_029976, partial [Zea mays]
GMWNVIIWLIFFFREIIDEYENLKYIFIFVSRGKNLINSRYISEMTHFLSVQTIVNWANEGVVEEDMHEEVPDAAHMEDQEMGIIFREKGDTIVP